MLSSRGGEGLPGEESQGAGGGGETELAEHLWVWIMKHLKCLAWESRLLKVFSGN